MKKVLLTKSQHIDRVSPAIVGSVVVDKSGSDNKKNSTSVIVSSKSVPLPIRVIPKSTGVITNTYKQRKSFQSVYEDIFKCLMRLPDKALHQRVIDAINGASNGTSCGNDKTTLISNQNKCSCGVSSTNVKKEHASTQTDFLKTEELIDKKTEISFSTVLKTESNLAKPTPTRDSGMIKMSIKPSATTATGKIPKKRGRKRNTCVPKVVMRSTAEMALQEREDKQLTPVVMKKRKLDIPNTVISKPVTNSRPSTPSNMPSRRNSTLSDISFDLDQIDTIESYVEKGISYTIRTMAIEYLKANTKSEAGLLPIHDAIIIGDIQAVQRQIYVWQKFKKEDINHLLTEDEEDCLQLAIQSDCDPNVMTVLLGAGILPNHIYENSNTALHLAVINNIQLESLRHLMERIDLNLLLQINDDGYTALHIAVRHNQYEVAEVILGGIDIRESNVVYSRSIDAPNENRTDVQIFSKFYELGCDQLELNQERLKRSRLKRDVINASEARAGNPPLFYAIEGEFEHLCYFLLAHLADPEEENLSGSSPRSFHYEYTRSLRINLKIGRIMDKVTNILNSSENSNLLNN